MEFHRNQIVDFKSRVQVDVEVLVIEDGLDAVVGRFLQLVSAASGWLNEDVLIHLTVRAQDEHPGVDSALAILVRLFVVLLVVVNRGLQHLCLLLISRNLRGHLVVPV